ncbi:MAG: CehA/McbA family metallohydrolase [Candidatus Brocadiia bacterium]
MNARRLTVTLLILGGLLWGCGPEQETVLPAPELLKPVLDLAGQSYVYRVSHESSLPAGPGAEARPGDVLLENAFVRFVVAGADHLSGGPAAGNLIDAAVQGGQDHMRLLTALPGSAPRRRPLYTKVLLSEPGGLERDAVAVAEGHLHGAPEIAVKTTYTLSPGEHAVRITTEVENGTEETLPLFELRDVLYHGRTHRYAPGAGFFPSGRAGVLPWLAFFHGNFVWGLVPGGDDPAEAMHGPGQTSVLYATVDLPPGEAHTWQRRVLADQGGVDAIAAVARGAESASRTRLDVAVAEQGSEEPVSRAAVWLEPKGAGRTGVAMTGARGLATMHLTPGRYGALVRAPGRPPMDLGSVLVSAGAAHRLGATVPEAASALVTVTERVRGEVRPAPAWLWARRSRRDGGRGVGQPPFPGMPWGEANVADETGRAELPLAPTSSGLTPHLMVAWRGPLHRVATSPLGAAQATTADLEAMLEQEVDAGSYVSVDFLQHSAGSPDCALTPGERRLLNAAAGLDAAVLSDPWGSASSSARLPAAIAAYRVEVPGLGALSLLAPEPMPPQRQELARAAAEAESAEDLLRAANRLFPDVPVQIDRPMDEGIGWLALHEHLPTEKFGLLELLHGSDVAGARRAMNEWFKLLSAGRRVVATGGSGSVGLAGPLPGLARTFVHCPAGDGNASAEQVRRAVLELPEHGNAFVSNGPFLEVTLDGQPIGSTVQPEDGTVRLHVRVLAPRWIDVSWCRIHRDGRVAREFPILPGTTVLRCDRTFDFPVEEDGWFVVEVEGERPMSPPCEPEGAPTPWAITNPFWVVPPAEEQGNG